MMKQKEAVFQAVCDHVEVDGVVTLEKSDRESIIDSLVEGFRSGKIELQTEYDDTKLRSYCGGLLSNWLRKDSRLNGGGKYVPKNPGSRVGSTDAQIKALKALRDSKSDATERAEIQTYIDKRTAEIQATKKTVAIDVNALPAELRKKYAA